MVIGFYYSRAYDQAVEAAEHLIRSFPEYPPSYRWLAAAHGQLGRTAEAKEALGKALAIAPVAFEPFGRPQAPWRRPEDLAHLLEGLRKAGMPEE
jgi:adenylate cyclase